MQPTKSSRFQNTVGRIRAKDIKIETEDSWENTFNILFLLESFISVLSQLKLTRKWNTTLSRIQSSCLKKTRLCKNKNAVFNFCFTKEVSFLYSSGKWKGNNGWGQAVVAAWLLSQQSLMFSMEFKFLYQKVFFSDFLSFTLGGFLLNRIPVGNTHRWVNPEKPLSQTRCEILWFCNVWLKSQKLETIGWGLSSGYLALLCCFWVFCFLFSKSWIQ